MQIKKFPKDADSKVLVELDSYDVYLLQDAIQTQIHSQVNRCSKGNIVTLFDLLDKFHTLLLKMDTPF